MKSIPVFVVFMLSVINASAVLLINFVESGSDVIMTGTGPLDLTGLSTAGTSTNAFGTTLQPNIPNLYSSNGPGNVDAYIGAFTATPFGVFQVNSGTSVTGDGFLLVGSGLLWVPEGYGASPYSLSFGVTYPGHSFASLGLTPGTFNTILPSDTISVVVGPVSPVIPEPSTYIALAGFAGLGLFIWRRRGKAKAVAETKA